MNGDFHAVPVPGSDRYVLFERAGFVALAERKENGFGRPGSAGILTEHGFAVLVWRGQQPMFVARNFEQPATPEQVESLRRFSAELEDHLRGAGASQ
ncbi:MAG TPA: hypothetical protein VKV15_16010 [Bryobacteraceae bacterium]|nr:hypothetical protein [Bryobacteraceae bacterium]